MIFFIQVSVLLLGPVQNTQNEGAESPQHPPLDVDELYLRHHGPEPHQPQLRVLRLLHDRRCYGAAGGPALHCGDQHVREEMVLSSLNAALWPHYASLCLF